MGRGRAKAISIQGAEVCSSGLWITGQRLQEAKPEYDIDRSEWEDSLQERTV